MMGLDSGCSSRPVDREGVVSRWSQICNCLIMRYYEPGLQLRFRKQKAIRLKIWAQSSKR